ncbi:MAG TPA: class I SAM-dependent methyltransferase [Blastocatellia bacterium]|nr:class I SAM-dependent methyltransferase [Blastocatellia bacterium]
MSSEYDETTYGNQIAGVYDDWHPTAPPEMIAALKDLAGAGPVLELGIGSGRVALPLAAQGVEVHGIDASEAMLDRLRAKSGAQAIQVHAGNFSEVPIEGVYSLVYIVFNTFFMLLSQEEQVTCFANVAKRLRPDGSFLIEAFVPDLTRFSRGQIVQATDVGAAEVKLDVSSHEPVSQRITSQHVVITAVGIKLYPIQMRYAWPSELDLMARLAGLRLRERWSNWLKAPFTAASSHHIAIYQS